MYELFVLGELCDKPMHGYLLHDILTNVLGPWRRVSWGKLYPVLKHLEAVGFIEAVVPGVSERRRKKVYAITAEGRARFSRLMAADIQANGDAEAIFRIKLSKMHLVDGAMQQAVLLQHCRFLETMLERVDVMAERVRTNGDIPGPERPDILQAIDYEAEAYRARLSWVNRALAQGGDSP